jgi:septal ring factor EnvC (AmiA/AmiB activator)
MFTPSEYLSWSKSRYVLLLLGFLSLSGNIYASKKEDMADYQEKLDNLKTNITKIQQHLKGSKKQRSTLLSELKSLELKISKNAIKLNDLEKNLEKTHKQKRKLEKELTQYNKQLDKEKTILSEQIRSAYSMGQQQNLKMLLNQQNPAQLGRSQQYYNYLNRARTRQISSFLETIENKRQAETQLQQTLDTQKKLLKSQKNKKRTQQKQRLQREQLLSELSDKIQNQEKTLSNLENSRNRIENLLKSLGELLADIPTGPSETRPFKSLKGRLPWPVKGRFLGKFGQAKNQGGLKWNGVLIKSDYGSPIRVITHGRVAFSDWLQGFGFITIIDHGDGFMSLYGHSESLLKQSGDWVKAGEVIATAGDSGGQTQSGVYFEIRARGKPVDPFKWCSSKVPHAPG